MLSGTPFKSLLAASSAAEQMTLSQSLHMRTETVQPPPVSICLRAQRSKSMGDHTRFLLIAVSRVVVGSWQSVRSSHCLCWMSSNQHPAQTGCGSLLQAETSETAAELVPGEKRHLPKGSSLKAAEKQDESWLKAMLFSSNLSKCLTSEDN